MIWMNLNKHLNTYTLPLGCLSSVDMSPCSHGAGLALQSIINIAWQFSHRSRPCLLPFLTHHLTNDLFSLSVCRDAKYRQKRGREKAAIKGAAKANVGDRKETRSAVIAGAHANQGPVCCNIRSLPRDAGAQLGWISEPQSC